MRKARLGVIGVAMAMCAGLASPAALDSKAFETTARFSVDAFHTTLSTAMATMEPRLGAPGYFWVRVHFYSFAPAAEDVAAAQSGSLKSMDDKRQKKASNTEDYNHSNAVIQLGIDKNYKVWQVDMAVPGHTCTIAPFEDDVKKFLQVYQFDGKTLKLKSKGEYVCDMKSVGAGEPHFGWDIDLDTPVFTKAGN